MSETSNLIRNDASSSLSRSMQDMKNSELSSNAKSFSVMFKSQKRGFIIVIVMFLINLLNYMDRYTIAGLLTEIKKYYHVTDDETGLLQTSFIISYTICSPLFGYLGDRISRKKIMICGITFWSIVTLASSFIPENMFPLFVLMRSLLGIGEASYSTVAPSIISDLFIEEWRTKLIAFFSFAIPIGSGLGFIMGTTLNERFGFWQAALRFTPIIGILCLLLMCFLVKEPDRGRAEGVGCLRPTSWIKDIKYLLKNRSFMFITLGFTVMCFVLGSLVWFAVIYLNYAKASCNQCTKNLLNTTYAFGFMNIVAGILGVIIGTETGRRLRRILPYADPLVCGFGLILSAPCILVGMVLAKYYFNWALVFIFITQILLCFNWALVIDMTMYVVNPLRRSSAAAIQMVVAHTLGDAWSPYFIGVIKQIIQKKFETSTGIDDANYYSMQYALLINGPMLIIGGLFFICTSFYIVTDKFNAIITNNQENLRNEPERNENTRIIKI